jgi:hypothetical protein
MKKERISFLHLTCFLLLAGFGCRKESSPVSPERAFYYWKHEYKTNGYEDSILSSLEIQKIYVKFFDVTYGEHGVMPVSEIIFDSTCIHKDIQYVPVIFITQSALLQTEEKLIDTLATRIIEKTLRIAARVGIPVQEIQLDCDWAAHSRDRYFRLVEVIRHLASQRNMITSCTIRLHQVKYKNDSGIPPCDRGMLMFYNMSDWRKVDTKNSIFDPEEAEKYLPYIKEYPLRLDVVLPIFRWAIAYRDNTFLAILEDINDNTIQNNSIFIPDGRRLRVLRDTFAFGAGLKAGDILRPEVCEAHTVADFSKRIFSLLPAEERSFALYHLDPCTLSHYSHDDLESLFPH